MEFLTLISDLGLSPWVLTISVILILLQITGLLKPLINGLKDLVTKLANGVAYLFNKRFATQQQTIVMTDRLFNFALDSADQSKEILGLLSDLKNLIEPLVDEDKRRREIESDIDTYMHELNEKMASLYRAMDRQARIINKLSRLDVSQPDKKEDNN